MYRFKLKEIEVGDTEIRGGKKSTVTDIDPETGAISWDVADVADFTSTYKALQQAKKFLDTLEKTGKSKNDTAIDQFAEEIANLFNSFRTHVRKNYPEEYERVSRLKEEETEETGEKEEKDVLFIDKYLKRINTVPEWQGILNRVMNLSVRGVTDTTKRKVMMDAIKQINTATAKGKVKEQEVDEGEGIGYLTPRAFSKSKKSTGAPDIYYYKLGFKPVPKTKPKGFEVKQLFEKTDRNEFQGKRIAAFKEIEERLNQIYPLLSNAKDETAEYYNENPGSYAIVYSTDYIFELLDEVEAKLKQSE